MLALLAAVWPSSTLAYLDPATGGILLQVVFGSVAVALVGVKLFWNYLKGMFITIINLVLRRKSDDSQEHEAEE